MKVDPKGKALEPQFFDRDAEIVARELIGCSLVCRRNHRLLKHKITETEAYVGPHDLACHSSKGRTKRTEVMFGPPGTLYIYLIYGLHWMLNVVTGPIGYPAAVLIRGVETLAGPARLTKSLDITGAMNGLAANETTGIWFEGSNEQGARVLRTVRIGVEYAGPVWSAKKYRFVSA
jgi:DNA-3-methyladenine glycosylase